MGAAGPQSRRTSSLPQLIPANQSRALCQQFLQRPTDSAAGRHRTIGSLARRSLLLHLRRLSPTSAPRPRYGSLTAVFRIPAPRCARLPPPAMASKPAVTSDSTPSPAVPTALVYGRTKSMPQASMPPVRMRSPSRRMVKQSGFRHEPKAPTRVSVLRSMRTATRRV